MTAMSKVPPQELRRVRTLRTAWQQAWGDEDETSLPQLLLGLERSLAKASKAAGVEGEHETGYPAIKIEVELPTAPRKVERPLELVQALTWNLDILERTLEALVAECRRRHYSWADIAVALNVARQSAWTKYASLDLGGEEGGEGNP